MSGAAGRWSMQSWGEMAANRSARVASAGRTEPRLEQAVSTDNAYMTESEAIQQARRSLADERWVAWALNEAGDLNEGALVDAYKTIVELADALHGIAYDEDGKVRDHLGPDVWRDVEIALAALEPNTGSNQEDE